MMSFERNSFLTRSDKGICRRRLVKEGAREKMTIISR